MEKVMGSSETAGVDPGMGPSFDLLCDIELDATLQFGSREMPAARLCLELGPGDVVELDRHVSEPVDLVVGDRIVARGEVVVVNGNFARCGLRRWQHPNSDWRAFDAFSNEEDWRCRSRWVAAGCIRSERRAALAGRQYSGRRRKRPGHRSALHGLPVRRVTEEGLRQRGVSSGWAMPWRNRRRPIFEGQWGCGGRCVLAMVQAAVRRELGDTQYLPRRLRIGIRVPLGLVMLAQGWITHPQLQRALAAQRESGAGTDRRLAHQ